MIREALTCPACGTLVHQDCQLDRCPTLGCESFDPWEWITLPVPRWAEARSPRRQPLLLLNAMLLALLVLGFVGEALVEGLSRGVFRMPGKGPLIGRPPLEPQASPRPEARLQRSLEREPLGKTFALEVRRRELFPPPSLRHESASCDFPHSPAEWHLGETKTSELLRVSGFRGGPRWLVESFIGGGCGPLLETADEAPSDPQREHLLEEREEVVLDLPAGTFSCTYRRTRIGADPLRLDVEIWSSPEVPIPVQTRVSWRTPGAPGGFPNTRQTRLAAVLPAEGW